MLGPFRFLCWRCILHFHVRFTPLVTTFVTSTATRLLIFRIFFVFLGILSPLDHLFPFRRGIVVLIATCHIQSPPLLPLLSPIVVDLRKSWHSWFDFSSRLVLPPIEPLAASSFGCEHAACAIEAVFCEENGDEIKQLWVWSWFGWNTVCSTLEEVDSVLTFGVGFALLLFGYRLRVEHWIFFLFREEPCRLFSVGRILLPLFDLITSHRKVSSSWEGCVTELSSKPRRQFDMQHSKICGVASHAKRDGS